ncbi:hypothetical protein [Mesorhizobium sp. M0767]|uniref:hypothetical protein n=1 Tax=Mesorhizobium sp. M0767 TaxID=2956995 RepID=UPI003339CB4F
MGDNIEGSTENTTIRTTRYESLLRSEKKLRALEEGGVDNWEGFGESTRHLYSAEDEE